MATVLAAVTLTGGLPGFAADGAGLHASSPAAVRREATKDVERRLREAEAPPGARPLGAAPPGSHLAGPGLVPDTKNLIERSRVWALRQSPTAALAWIERHAPAGLPVKVRSGLGIGAKTVRREIGFEWKPLAGRVNGRMLYFAVATAADGRTILRVESQGVWVLPHPAGAMIPPATTLEVLRKPEEGGAQSRQVVTDRRAIGRLAAQIDRLLPLQPVGFEECGPGLPEGLTEVTLIFRDADGAVVAEAVQKVPEGWCTDMELTIEGKVQPLLVGGGAMLQRQLPLLPHRP